MLALRALVLAMLLGAVAFAARPAAGQAGWAIRSFDVRYEVDRSGSVRVSEDIRVDFDGLQQHGLLRDMPVEYAYDDEYNRLITPTDFAVDDGSLPVPFELSREGPDLRIKIGDPDIFVTGVQRYRISYTIEHALNPFDDHDELYWNVTGDEWEAPIERATATVILPGPVVREVECFQGPRGSTTPCSLSFDESGASFAAAGVLEPGSGLTIVVGLEKGAVSVGDPVLVDADASVQEQIADFVGLGPLSLAVATFLSVLLLAGLGQLWWLHGRDRWYGDTYYLAGEPSEPATRPLFAHQTIVVEYTPPEAAGDGANGARALRPAEIGVLLDERADTLDVSATIVDLAVRDYLMIAEHQKGGLFGVFQSPDYQLVRQEKADDGLLPYERALLHALFKSETSVLLSELKGEFHEELASVKSKLYDEATKQKYFARDPESARNFWRMAGAGVAVAGGLLTWLLGARFGLGLIPLPIVAGGLGLVALAPAMPRRTPKGWHAYRRCLGFRLFMVTAETDRMRFAEDENIFHEYLPYAIVYGCVEKWAERFEALGIEPRQPSWYTGSSPFRAMAFANGMRDFSTSISGAMASTPGGSGGSGFGGGFSGGGGGGGGGGRW
ncbi:MAG: DUF2207 domain-containing protein [Dehalococcoidia bacterium]